MLVMTAILLVVIIGLAALAIDVGSFYQAQRQAQAAADAGALAGADALAAGSSTAAAASTATTLANTNYPSTTTPTATINGQTITVNVANTTPAYFGQIFGVSSENVGARAVASGTVTDSPCTTAGSSCYAIFAMDSSCSSNGVNATTGNITITGGVHSNGSISGHANNGYGPTSYGPTANGCTATPQSDFAGGTAVSGPVITSWPIDYSVTYPKCGASLPVKCTGPGLTPSYCTVSSPINLNYSSSLTGTSSGIYCDYGTGSGVDPSDPSTWKGALSFTGSASVTYNGTFIAGSISVSGGNQTFNPAQGNALLFYATQADPSGSLAAIDLAGGGSTFTGHMFAPNGKINVKTGGNSTNFLEAKDVVLAGGGMTITGSGPQVPSGGGNSSGVASLTQ